MLALSYRVDGPAEATPLVLLNSVGSTVDMWTPCLGPLAEQLRVVRVDTRGHGESPPSAPGTVTELADLAGDVVAVLDALGIERAHMAGLSLGGMVTMWLAINRPERVSRIALLCTSAQLGPASTWRDRAAAVRAGGMGAIVDAVIARWITPSLAARDAALVERLGAMVGSVDAETYAQCCEAIMGMDLRADLGRIAAPTLVIGAEHDPATPPEHQRLIAAGVPGATFELLADAAHVATVEQPGRIAALLLEHFRAGGTTQAGYRVRRAVLGDAYVDRAVAGTTELTADFQQFLTRYAWGEVWTRTDLSRRDRSIATVAALVTLGAEHELAAHLHGAVRNGLSPAEIVGLLQHLSVYAGMPRANRAVAIARDVLADVATPEEGDTQ